MTPATFHALPVAVNICHNTEFFTLIWYFKDIITFKSFNVSYIHQCQHYLNAFKKHSLMHIKDQSQNDYQLNSYD